MMMPKHLLVLLLSRTNKLLSSKWNNISESNIIDHMYHNSGYIGLDKESGLKHYYFNEIYTLILPTDVNTQHCIIFDSCKVWRSSRSAFG